MAANRPRLLDLFCGAGGAAMGYHRAGFEVIGVDDQPQPRYPFKFKQADALVYLDERLRYGGRPDVDAIHASPPCQAYSVATKAWNGRIKRAAHPDLIAGLRELLEATGLPYVIENVIGAPLKAGSLLLCGTMFDPPMAVQRHRLFEANWPGEEPMWPCRHDLWAPQFPPTRSDRTKPARTVSVFGAGGGRAKNFELWKWAMEIDWMTKTELAEAIPPTYTKFIGQQLFAYIRQEAAA